MRLRNLFISLSLALVMAPHFSEAAKRSYSAKREFRDGHPCPSTNSTKGPCAGYVIDHIMPLCAGGADSPLNMQWQTVEDGKRKDRDERKLCALR